MTVSYTAEVSQCTWFGCFPKLLLRWRASIYKLIWLDISIYITIYYAINTTYRFLLNDEQKKSFEVFVKYCSTSSSLIPLMFVLGFYVSIVIKRWWGQYMTLPWPDSTAVYVSSLIRGQDENGRKMRRTIMRYVCLSLTMVLTMISPRVKRRFPTLDHLVDAGLLVENEKVILENMNEKFSKHPKHWMPIVWASSIVTRARKESRIRDDSSLKTIIDSLNNFRGMCMVLLFYDTISIPLVYTQVVTIAVYSYLFTSVFGHQWTGETDDDGILDIVDYFFPLLTALEYIFFMGWLKVAESLICPFGDDDDDFEVNWLIDRNIQVSYLIVDEMHNEHPELIKDQYWDEVFPSNLSRETEFVARKPTDEAPPPFTTEWNKPPEKKINFKQSVTRFFSRHYNREQPQSISVTSNLNDINSALRNLLSPSIISDEVPDTSHQNFRAVRSLNLVRHSSEELSIKKDSQPKSSKSEDQESDFEKLKKQRELERLSRLNKYTMKDKTDDNEELKTSTSVASNRSNRSQDNASKKNSTSKLSSNKSNESKKSV